MEIHEQFFYLPVHSLPNTLNLIFSIIICTMSFIIFCVNFVKMLAIETLPKSFSKYILNKNTYLDKYRGIPQLMSTSASDYFI